MLKKIIIPFIILLTLGLTIFLGFFINENFVQKDTVKGTIESFIISMDEKEIKLKDKYNNIWNADITDKTIFKTQINFYTGIKLKVIGNKDIKNHSIIATEISEIK